MREYPSLISLYTELVDTKNGYTEAVKDAERSDLRALFQEMIALHESALEDLRPALKERRGRADDRGSFMSMVHEAVISIRSAVTGLDGALPEFASGEERNLKAYDEAFEEAANDPTLIQTLERHREALLLKIESMKSAAERT